MGCQNPDKTRLLSLRLSCPEIKYMCTDPQINFLLTFIDIRLFTYKKSSNYRDLCINLLRQINPMHHIKF